MFHRARGGECERGREKGKEEREIVRAMGGTYGDGGERGGARDEVAALRGREEAVGIRCFVAPEEEARGREALCGVFKHRFTDFVVREVDLAGNVARLDTLIEANKGGANGGAATEQPAQAAITVNWADDTEALAALRGLVCAEDVERFVDFLKRLQAAAGAGNAEGKSEGGSGAAGGASKSNELVLAASDDKEKRTQVHQLFKSKPGNVPMIATDTVVAVDKATGVETKSIRLLAVLNRDDRKRKRAMDNRSSGGVAKFCKFLLYKENVETQHALQMLCHSLRCKPKRLGFAGTKDKRGVTIQWCTGFKITEKQLSYFNRGGGNR